MGRLKIKYEKEGKRKEEGGKDGGSPPPSLKEWEKKIVGVLKEVVVDGIEGGLDTFAAENHVEEITKASSSFANQKDDTQTILKTKDSNKTIPMKDKQKDLKEDLQTDKENCECTSKLLKIEEEKLQIMREMLTIEREKLKILKDKQQNVFTPEATACIDSPVIKLRFA